MKIHGICIVKDEVDVLPYALEAAANWCDFIYVFDNGSTDGSWEAVQRLSQKLANIIPYTQDDRPFRNTFRKEVFDAYKDNASIGDWWCKLDADEFYIDHPHRFLVRVPDDYNLVYGSHFQFQFTDKDLEQYESNPHHYDERPVHERLRYYINNWSEARFVRHSERGGIWNSGHPQAGPVFPVRIWVKHFQYRSPEQIQRRLALRRQAAHAGAGFRHEISKQWGASLGVQRHPENTTDGMQGKEWRERVVPSDALYLDRGDGRFVPRDDLLKPLPRSLRREMHTAYSLARAGAATRWRKARERFGLP